VLASDTQSSEIKVTCASSNTSEKVTKAKALEKTTSSGALLLLRLPSESRFSFFVLLAGLRLAGLPLLLFASVFCAVVGNFSTVDGNCGAVDSGCKFCCRVGPSCVIDDCRGV
jgi:hypothetical protein